MQNEKRWVLIFSIFSHSKTSWQCSSSQWFSNDLILLWATSTIQSSSTFLKSSNSISCFMTTLYIYTALLSVLTIVFVIFALLSKYTRENESFYASKLTLATLCQHCFSVELHESKVVGFNERRHRWLWDSAFATSAILSSSWRFNLPSFPPGAIMPCSFPMTTRSSTDLPRQYACFLNWALVIEERMIRFVNSVVMNVNWYSSLESKRIDEMNVFYDNEEGQRREKGYEAGIWQKGAEEKKENEERQEREQERDTILENEISLKMKKWGSVVSMT